MPGRVWRGTTLLQPAGVTGECQSLDAPFGHAGDRLHEWMFGTRWWREMAEALQAAREAAGGKDVRLGGGPTMIRDLVAAGLVDHMHIVVSRSCSAGACGSGTDRGGLEENYEIEATSSPSGVTHMTFTRAGS